MTMSQRSESKRLDWLDQHLPVLVEVLDGPTVPTLGHECIEVRGGELSRECQSFLDQCREQLKGCPADLPISAVQLEKRIAPSLSSEQPLFDMSVLPSLDLDRMLVSELDMGPALPGSNASVVLLKETLSGGGVGLKLPLMSAGEDVLEKSVSYNPVGGAHYVGDVAPPSSSHAEPICLDGQPELPLDGSSRVSVGDPLKRVQLSSIGEERAPPPAEWSPGVESLVETGPELIGSTAVTADKSILASLVDTPAAQRLKALRSSEMSVASGVIAMMLNQAANTTPATAVVFDGQVFLKAFQEKMFPRMKEELLRSLRAAVDFQAQQTMPGLMDQFKEYSKILFDEALKVSLHQTANSLGRVENEERPDSHP